MNKKSDFPLRPVPDMFCFGGFNVSVQIDKIKDMEAIYYRTFDDNVPDVPILHITLNDGTIITQDYNDIKDVKKIIKEFKKFKMRKYIQKP